MHRIEKCRHGRVVRNCRCPEDHKLVEIVACPPECAEPTYVTVLVARELLAKIHGKWSPPVQVQIVETPGFGTGWEMRARTLPIGCAATADEPIVSSDEVNP